MKETSWSPRPEAVEFVRGHLRSFVTRMPLLAEVAERIFTTTSTRLWDYVDHLVLPHEEPLIRRLAELGFVAEPESRTRPGDRGFVHAGAVLPRILTRPAGGDPRQSPLAVALQVEDLSAFLMTLKRPVPIDGAPLGPYRAAVVQEQHGYAFLACERRGSRDYLPPETAPDHAQRYLAAFEKWRDRPREFARPAEGLVAAQGLADDLVAEFGADGAAWIACAAERDFWQQRNLAGRVQRRRQDSLGLGWANHDHHTFRSSRAVFTQLIKILETLGFRCRERFYAGAEAGWGAQVLEQPAGRLVAFADVDLSPGEVGGDFAHEPLAPRDELGTVGLWCALHGESMLSAGLHHLATRFDFEAFTRDIAHEGITMLAPFTDTAILRQAFSQGETWPVSPARLRELRGAARITEQQHQRFADHGAIGSHIENIQREEGFKGFNQRGVSDIIRRTDPRAEGGAA